MLAIWQAIMRAALALEADKILAADVGQIRYLDTTCAANPCLPAWMDGKKCVIVDSDSKVCSYIHWTVQDI